MAVKTTKAIFFESEQMARAYAVALKMYDKKGCVCEDQNGKGWIVVWYA